MSESHIIFSCGYCDHVGEANEFMTGEYPVALECVDRGACERRQKRDLILIEMKEMAKKPRVHPVDKFSFASISLCAGFLLGTLVTCLLFLFGF